MRLTHNDRKIPKSVIAMTPLMVDDPGMLPRCMVIRALTAGMEPDDRPVPDKYVVHEMAYQEDGKPSYAYGHYFHTSECGGGAAFAMALQNMAYRAAEKAGVSLPVLAAAEAALSAATHRRDGTITIIAERYNGLRSAFADLTGNRVGVPADVD